MAFAVWCPIGAILLTMWWVCWWEGGGHGIMVCVSASAAVRTPGDWLDDMAWHRRMFRQSRFRWVPEDPLSIALAWTRGRLVYETPRDLRFLDERLSALREFAAGIDDAMLAPLSEAEERCTPADWQTGLGLVGLAPRDVTVLRYSAPSDVAPHREAVRALRGIPLPNPFSQVWELRQVRGMYSAAEDLLEDTFCDLAVELAPTQGWEHLARMTVHHTSARTLQLRVEDQRASHGEPGDARRSREQHYS